MRFKIGEIIEVFQRFAQQMKEEVRKAREEAVPPRSPRGPHLKYHFEKTAYGWNVIFEQASHSAANWQEGHTQISTMHSYSARQTYSQDAVKVYADQDTRAGRTNTVMQRAYEELQEKIGQSPHP